MNLNFQHHYNYQRPNQAITCQNQPPRLAFPDLPELGRLPDIIDPDLWLSHIAAKPFKRRINANGSVKLDKQFYYVRRALKGHYVSLQIEAQSRQIQVFFEGQIIKSMPLKGLQSGLMAWADYLALIKAQAVSQWRTYLASARRYVQFVA